MSIKEVRQKNVCFPIIWFFKDVGLKFEEHVCNGCHDLLTMAIFIAKGATFRCILWGISRNEALRRLNNFVPEDEGVL